MNPGVDYEKEIRRTTIGIVASAIVLMLAFSIGLSALFFYLDAMSEGMRAQKREEIFNPWEDSADGIQNSYKTWEIVGLTEEFAADFKNTYHYYFAFDSQKYLIIVKMKGELGEEFAPYMDFIYEDGAESPDPMTIRGTASPIGDDIRGFAIESLNLLYDEEFMTEDNFEDYLGISLLDLTEKPMGKADFTFAGRLGIVSGIMAALGICFLVNHIRVRKNIRLARQREMEMRNSEETVCEQPDGTAGVKVNVPIETETGGNSPKSRVLPGILGAFAGAMIGVLVWVAIGIIGFIAGIAGFLILEFALAGYRKMSGYLDKKGQILSLVIAAFMVFAANVLSYVIIFCRVFFRWEASLDTVEYVIRNFVPLLGEMDCWGRFLFDLTLGYFLSAWSCSRVIKEIVGSHHQ